MEDLTWIAVIVAPGGLAFLYIRLLGGGGADAGGEQGA
jgi:hypothetical protein